MSVTPAEPRAASVELTVPSGLGFEIKSLFRRIITLCWVEVCKIDRKSVV